MQGVVSVAPYENCTNEVDSAGRWPHSIEVVVEGGDATEIAQQILNTKAGGINTFGSVETTLHGVYGEDIVVRFNRPTYVKVWFKVGVTLSPNTNPPTNYVELVKEQILEKMSALGRARTSSRRSSTFRCLASTTSTYGCLQHRMTAICPPATPTQRVHFGTGAGRHRRKQD